MAEVVLEHVSKVFPGGVHAVRDVSLRIADEEFVVLVGPSGCGKSTTLRMVAGLEEISEGTIRIGDRVINDVPPKDRDIAMVFQNYALYPHMTVYKNLAFALKLRRTPRREIGRLVREAAGVLGITDLLDRKPGALSGGQKQRVAVGRAIVRQPAAFLFDEPLSNLDAKLRVEMRAELKRLHTRLRTTTIYVTHDQEEAMTLGDRIVVMKDGRVHQSGPPLEVYQRPTNRFVAGFVGTPPMNFLPGRVVGENGKVWFVESPGEQTGGEQADRDETEARQDRTGDESAEARHEETAHPTARDDMPPSLRAAPARSAGPARIRLSEAQAARLSDPAGRDVVLGVRPEAMAIDAPGEQGARAQPGEGDNALPVVVQVVEPLGEKMDLHAITPAGTHVVARVDARQGIQADQQLRLRVDPRRLHVFEPGEDGKNLTLD